MTDPDFERSYPPFFKGIDPIPWYELSTHGILCKRCGIEFIGIHSCPKAYAKAGASRR